MNEAQQENFNNHPTFITTPTVETLKAQQVLKDLRALISANPQLENDEQLKWEFVGLRGKLDGFYARTSDGSLEEIHGGIGMPDKPNQLSIKIGVKYYSVDEIIDIYSVEELSATMQIKREDLFPKHEQVIKSQEEIENLVKGDLVWETIVKNIRGISFQEFDSARKDLIVGENGLNSILADGQPFAIIAGAAEGKSNYWVYQLSKDEITKPPEKVLFFGPNSKGRIKELLEKGIKRFVAFDDAIYSGNQIAGTLVNPLQAILTSEDYKPIGTEKVKDIEIILVTPYITNLAEKNLLFYNSGEFLGTTVNIKILKKENIPTVAEILTPQQLKQKGGRNLTGTTLTYFQHKIPDDLSLDARARQLIVDKFVPPPYNSSEIGLAYRVNEETLWNESQDPSYYTEI